MNNLNKKQTKDITSADKKNNKTEKTKETIKELIPLSEKEKEWLFKFSNLCIKYSPLRSEFFRPTEMYDSLKEIVSEKLLLENLPKSSPDAAFEIIEEQFEQEPEQWVEYFNHFLQITPSFLFNSESQNPQYFSKKAIDFLDFLYTPLQKQYDTLLTNIINYNYSPFSIDINLFKNK